MNWNYTLPHINVILQGNFVFYLIFVMSHTCSREPSLRAKFSHGVLFPQLVLYVSHVL